MSRSAFAPRRRLTSLLTIALAVALTGAPSCAGSSDAERPTADETTTTTVPRSSTTRVTEPEEATGAGRKSFIEANAKYFELAQHPEQSVAPLAENRMGASLVRVQDLIVSFQRDGVEVHFPSGRAPQPTVAEIVADGADLLVTSCLVDTGVQIRKSDGAVINDAVVSQLTKARMKFDGATWKIDSQDEISKWHDGLGCRQ